MAIANACMEVIRDENLQENAHIVGEYTKNKLLELQKRHDTIGDVRYKENISENPLTRTVYKLFCKYF